MKKFILPTFLLLSIVLTLGWSGGPTNTNGLGYSGSPGGSGQVCGNCHGGGNYGEPNVDLRVSTSLGGPAVFEYVPGQRYFVRVAVTPAMGTPSRYGFQAVFLDEPTAGTPQQAGTLGAAGAGVQFSPSPDATAPERFYAEQAGASPSGKWTFEWTAPSAGTGTVNIYTVGNTVNFDGSISGDNGSTQPTVITLAESSLPVVMTAFGAQRTKASIELRWQTASEDQSDYFAVERSTDGEAFTPIGRRSARGHASLPSFYEFTDAAPPAATSFYRLRMHDYDGSYAYSTVVSVPDYTENLRIYPNPTTDRIILSTSLSQTATITLLDIRGVPLRRLAATREVDVRGLRAGTYLLRVTDGDDVRVVRFLRR